jgi:hypothetical protein
MGGKASLAAMSSSKNVNHSLVIVGIAPASQVKPTNVIPFLNNGLPKPENKCLSGHY